MKDGLVTLGDLYIQGETKKACSMGVVIDVAAPARTSSGSDYVLRLKIMDETLNQDSTLGDPGHRFCTVFIFGPKPENLPQITEIGSVIYLRRADFTFFKNDFQAKLSGKKFTSWVVYSGDPSRLDVEPLQSNRDDISQEDRFNLRSNVVSLRTFCFNYFRKNSVALVSPKTTSSNDFDCLMRVTECRPALDRHLLYLTDGREKFKLYFDFGFSPEQVVKVRGIAQIDWGDEPLLKPNDYTWVLRVPEWMKSFKEVGSHFINRDN